LHVVAQNVAMAPSTTRAQSCQSMTVSARHDGGLRENDTCVTWVGCGRIAARARLMMTYPYRGRTIMQYKGFPGTPVQLTLHHARASTTTR
jgi:hypothetical protein